MQYCGRFSGGYLAKHLQVAADACCLLLSCRSCPALIDCLCLLPFLSLLHAAFACVYALTEGLPHTVGMAVCAGLALITCILIHVTCPQYDRPDYRVPFFPYLPAASLLLNCFLMVSTLSSTFVRRRSLGGLCSRRSYSFLVIKNEHHCHCNLFLAHNAGSTELVYGGWWHQHTEPAFVPGRQDGWATLLTVEAQTVTCMCRFALSASKGTACPPAFLQPQRQKQSDA